MNKLAPLQPRQGNVSEEGHASSPTNTPQRASNRVASGLWNSTKFGELFGANLRSLALLRIALAILVLMDIAGRARDLGAHYTDAGVLPRDTAISSLNQWRWSVNLANGTLTFQAILFLITAVAALALLVGFKTRLMNVIVWIMIISIQVRNPLLSSGADTLLRMLLFWSMLLPLGAYWSLDSRTQGFRAKARSLNVLSFATFGIYMQICFMYWFTAALKSSPEWLSRGTALFYATGAGQITRPFGDYIHQFPTLLRFLTHASLGVEIVTPILLFSPFFTGPVRTAAIASIVAFHVGIYLTMDVGIFPFTSALCMVCFLPAWFWDSALPRVWASLVQRFPRAQHAKDAAVPAIQALTSKLPGGTATGEIAQVSGSDHQSGNPGQEYASAPVKASPATSSGSGSRDYRQMWRILTPPYLANLFAAFCLLFVFGWNLTSVTDFRMPQESRPVAYGLGLYQKWNMFAPRPPTSTRWYVIRGELQNGQEVDLLTPIVYDDLNRVPALSWEEPDDIVGEYYRDKYWRKYFDAIGQSNNKEERQKFAAYACRTWNDHYAGGVELARVEIYLMSTPTSLDNEEFPVRKTTVGEYKCT